MLLRVCRITVDNCFGNLVDRGAVQVVGVVGEYGEQVVSAVGREFHPWRISEQSSS